LSRKHKGVYFGLSHRLLFRAIKVFTRKLEEEKTEIGTICKRFLSADSYVKKKKKHAEKLHM